MFHEGFGGVSTSITVHHFAWFLHGMPILVTSTLKLGMVVVSPHPLDLAELHSFRLVYFKHKEIFLVVCIVSDEVRCYLCPFTGLALSGPLLHCL